MACTQHEFQCSCLHRWNISVEIVNSYPEFSPNFWICTWTHMLSYCGILQLVFRILLEPVWHYGLFKVLCSDVETIRGVASEFKGFEWDQWKDEEWLSRCRYYASFRSPHALEWWWLEEGCAHGGRSEKRRLGGFLEFLLVIVVHWRTIVMLISDMRLMVHQP